MAVMTEQQVTFLETFGYLRLPGLFAGEIGEITEAFEAVFADSTIDRIDMDEPIHHHDQRVMIPAFVDRHPVLARLPVDERLRGIARTVLGDDVVYTNSDGNLASCPTDWHVDAYGSPITQRHLKISFYLDRLRTDSGAIRVLPGTHFWRSGYATALRGTFNEVGTIRDVLGVDSTAIPATVIDSDPGDVLMWDYRLLHASFNGMERRRFFTLNFRQPDGGPPGGS